MTTIPGYPAATTPLSGDEQVAAWQNGEQISLPVSAVVDAAKLSIVPAIDAAADRTRDVTAKFSEAASLAGYVDPSFGGTVGTLEPLLATDPGGGISDIGVPGAMVRVSYSVPEPGLAATFRTMVGADTPDRIVRFFVASSLGVVTWVSPDKPAPEAGLVDHACTLADTPSLPAGSLFGVTSTGNPHGVQVFSSNTVEHADRAIYYNEGALDPKVGDDISGWPTVKTFFPLLELDYVQPDPLVTKPYLAAQAKPLRGMTIAVNGDSISTPRGQGQPLDGGDNWPALLGQITGATIINHSLGSTAPNWDPANPTVGLSATRAELTAAGLEPAFSYEEQMLPNAADLWINTMGHNSVGRPVGAVDTSRTSTIDFAAFVAGLDRSTFIGSQQYLIEQRLKAFPLGGIMLTTNTCLFAPYYAAAGQTDALAKIAAIRAATLALAAFYALPVIDFGREGQISAARVKLLLAPDGLHPLKYWHATYGAPLAVAEVLKVLRP